MPWKKLQAKSRSNTVIHASGKNKNRLTIPQMTVILSFKTGRKFMIEVIEKLTADNQEWNPKN